MSQPRVLSGKSFSFAAYTLNYMENLVRSRKRMLIPQDLRSRCLGYMISLKMSLGELKDMVSRETYIEEWATRLMMYRPSLSHALSSNVSWCKGFLAGRRDPVSFKPDTINARLHLPEGLHKSINQFVPYRDRRPSWRRS